MTNHMHLNSLKEHTHGSVQRLGHQQKFIFKQNNDLKHAAYIIKNSPINYYMDQASNRKDWNDQVSHRIWIQ